MPFNSIMVSKVAKHILKRHNNSKILASLMYVTPNSKRCQSVSDRRWLRFLSILWQLLAVAATTSGGLGWWETRWESSHPPDNMLWYYCKCQVGWGGWSRRPAG